MMPCVTCVMTRNTRLISRSARSIIPYKLKRIHGGCIKFCLASETKCSTTCSGIHVLFGEDLGGYFFLIK